MRCHLLIASTSGSHLGPLVSGAGHVILVIGAQKIVSDIATGLRRVCSIAWNACRE